MYRKKRLLNSGKSFGSISPFTDGKVRIARSMSYYVNGGVDLDGISTRMAPESHFDSPEDIAAESVDVTSDPTVSRLDIAEMASSRMAKSTTKRSAKKFVDTPENESDSD